MWVFAKYQLCIVFPLGNSDNDPSGHVMLTRALLEKGFTRCYMFCSSLLTTCMYRPQDSSEVWEKTVPLISSVFRRVRKIAKKKRLLASPCLSARPSVCMEQLRPTGSIFMNLTFRVFFENLSKKIKFHDYLTKLTCTWHADQTTFIIISRGIIFRMRNVLYKFVERFKTHILHSIPSTTPWTIMLFVR
jgi:hypothetical protein